MPISSKPSYVPSSAGMVDGRTSPPAGIPNGRWFHIISPVMALCVISYMDRTAIAFAIPGGMAKDLALSFSAAGLAAGIFFIGYLFLQVPGGALAARGAAKHFLTASIVAWGTLSVATAFVTSEKQLIVLRFLLGLSEGGMLPAVLTMVAKWFPNHERGRATAVVIMFVPIANLISGPLGGGNHPEFRLARPDAVRRSVLLRAADSLGPDRPGRPGTGKVDLSRGEGLESVRKGLLLFAELSDHQSN